MNIFELVGTIALQGAEAAEKQLQGIEAFAKKNEKTFKVMGAAMTGAGLAITGALAFATKSALDEEIGINRLNVALRNTGTSYANLKDEIEAAIQATQRKTNYSDGEQREALAQLVSVTGTYTGALHQLQIATDLAAAKNMDLNTAAMLVGRAATGNTQLLSRYGIVVKEGATSTEVLAMMQERFAGAAQGAVNPLTQLKNELGDIAEDVGAVLVPVLRSAVDFIKPVIAQVRDWIKANPDLTKGIVVLAGTLGILMGTVIGPLLLTLPKLVAGFMSVRTAVLAVHASTILWTVVSLAAIAAIYGIINLVRSFKGEAYVGTSFGDTVFGQIKQDIGALMGKLGELLPASDAAITETTNNAQAGFDGMAESVGGATTALDTFNQKAQETRDAERRLAMDFTDLWRKLTYSDTAAGKLNLTMEDVYEALHKMGAGVEVVASIFDKYQFRQDAVNQVLQEYGWTVEQVAKLVGKLTEATEKQTVALKKQADAAREAAAASGGTTVSQQQRNEAARLGLSVTPWGTIIGPGERALGPGPEGQRPEYIGGRGLTGRLYANGGPIEEPTLLTRLRDMKPYAIAGENGPERVVSGRGGGVVVTGNIFNVRKESDIDRIAEALVGKIRLQQGLRGI